MSVSEQEKTIAAQQKCGHIAFLGLPNAGKSTLLNQIIGEKLAIVTPKPQTTRNRILGVKIKEECQLIFCDAPGVFTPRTRLDRAMVAQAWQDISRADVVLLIVDVTLRNIWGRHRDLLDRLKAAPPQKTWLCLNKIDCLAKPRLLGLAERFDKLNLFEAIYMISAQKGDGLDRLLSDLGKELPSQPWRYEKDYLTNLSERIMAAEITREKIFLQLHQELPYAMAVETENWQENMQGSGRLLIQQVIYVTQNSHKAMVLGKGGQRLKEIGKAARLEMQELFDKKIHLELFVKHKANWQDDPEFYHNQGLPFA